VVDNNYITLIRKPLGMECVRKEEIIRYATMVKTINIPGPRRVDYEISRKDMKTLMEKM